MSSLKQNQRLGGHPLGLHRVLDPKPILPQAAQKLDASLPIYDNEIGIDVEALQIDSASFAQLKSICPNEGALKKMVLDIVTERGKMQNPVTGSGGMLLGTVVAKGENYPDKKLKVGSKIATLISLTATPLALKNIESVDFARERLSVQGHAILFVNSLYAALPQDIPEGAALAAFDICGAPLSCCRHAKKGDRVLILGLGKAGCASLAALNLKFSDSIQIFGLDPRSEAVDFCRQAYPRGIFGVANAQNPIEVLTWIETQTQNQGCDFVINTANVVDTEMASILATREGGRCLFFGMATSFQKAALGCEAVAKDIALMIGTGYTAGHADFILDVLRQDPHLKSYFVKEFDHGKA
jgi:L-erythro-3,5-diaminohexanoate dehydrogenase